MKEPVAIRIVSVLILLLLLGGCARLREASCVRHEEAMRNTKPVTSYRLVETPAGKAALRSLPAGSTPQVSRYTLRFKPGYTQACASITLYKDVTIQRSLSGDVILNEIREFYAEDGTLITSNTQDVTAQVRTSGYYLASTPLPIPRAAPHGKYKIVSKLLYERRGSNRPAVQIARGEGYFYIVPDDE